MTEIEDLLDEIEDSMNSKYVDSRCVTSDGILGDYEINTIYEQAGI